MVETSSDPPLPSPICRAAAELFARSHQQSPGRRLALVSPQASLGGAWCVQRPLRLEENLPERLPWAMQLMPFGGTLGTPPFMGQLRNLGLVLAANGARERTVTLEEQDPHVCPCGGKQLRMPGRHYLHVFMNSVRPEVCVHESLCKEMYFWSLSQCILQTL
uniref:Uncharacterized protein n=1 Tax=Micrurus surinamensis TaxID=129470 RepID=A0A2D4P2B9_MICSU